MTAIDDEENHLRNVEVQNAHRMRQARDRAAEDLRAQSEWVRVALATIGDAVISTDEAGQVTFMNGVAESLTGWPQGEAIGRPLPEVFDILEEHSRLPVENPALRAVRDGRIGEPSNPTILVSQDGTERPIHGSASPVRSESASTIGAVLVFRDVTANKQAEEVHARLAAIVESSQDAIISKTLDYTIRSWNRAAEQLFGYSAAEAIGRPITLIIPPERQHEERHIVERLLRGERIEHFETVRITKEGRLIDVSLSVSPIYDSAGKIIGAAKIARDVTARKAAEAARLKLQEEVEAQRSRLEEVFRLAPSFLAVLRGPQHVFELANQRYFQLIGNRDVIGRPVLDALPEIEGQGLIELLDRVYQTGQAFVATDMRVMIQRDPQCPLEEVFLEFVYQPLRDEHEAISGIIAQGIDLTERKRVQTTLASVTAESERRRRLYETILSSTPDFIYVFSLDHRILYANEALLTMWNRRADEAIGKTFLDIGYELWHAEMHCREIDEVRSTKRPVRGEVPFSGAHGRRIYDYIFVPVFGADGEVEAVAGTTRDVTERRQMEDLLRETDRNKDEFIALLAHELRNPLAPIRNGLQVMQLGEHDPQVMAEVRGMMERQMGHMVRLIDDLMDISRLSQNKMQLRRARVQLTDVITNAVETARTAIDEAHHELTIQLPSEPIYLDADLTRLAQVFSNLLTNSAKYTEPGGRIHITATLEMSTVVITVRDSGIGIPAESLPRVFDMFSQVDRNMERSSGGLGIGLALVKALVEKHGGTVRADSAGPGKGSQFIVTLETIANSMSAPREDADSPAAPRGRVLVVDDNRDAAKSMAMMLKLLGHEVATAYDGVEAVEVAEHFLPSLILMDVGMPRMNGYDATRRIREQPAETPVTIIALTGWGQEGDRACSKAAGCDGHLVKPVSLEELKKLLANLPGTTDPGGAAPAA